MINFLNVLTGTDLIFAGLALILVLVLSLSLHEFAHAFVAYKQGDPTPKQLGRVTINPLAHIDPIGFVACVFFGFGWAKPVPINPIRFRNYKKGYFLTSIAGVLVNLFLAFIGCGLYYLCLRFININNGFGFFLTFFAQFLFIINLSLFVFNLLPIYPLDGFNMINAYAKPNNSYVNFMLRYGQFILLAVVLFGGTLLFRLIQFVAMPIELFWGLFL